jgi:hypothetical protein
MLVSWAVMPCGLVGDTNVSEKYTVSIFRKLSPYGVTAPKTNTENFNASRNSNLIRITNLKNARQNTHTQD